MLRFSYVLVDTRQELRRSFEALSFFLAASTGRKPVMESSETDPFAGKDYILLTETFVHDPNSIQLPHHKLLHELTRKPDRGRPEAGLAIGVPGSEHAKVPNAGSHFIVVETIIKYIICIYSPPQRTSETSCRSVKTVRNSLCVALAELSIAIFRMTTAEPGPTPRPCQSLILSSNPRQRSPRTYATQAVAV